MVYSLDGPVYVRDRYPSQPTTRKLDCGVTLQRIQRSPEDRPPKQTDLRQYLLHPTRGDVDNSRYPTGVGTLPSDLYSGPGCTVLTCLPAQVRRSRLPPSDSHVGSDPRFSDTTGSTTHTWSYVLGKVQSDPGRRDSI